jgi:hypothetical protein
MKSRYVVVLLIIIFACLFCSAFAPPDDILGHEAGHYWGQAWSGYEEEQISNYKVKEDFYFDPLTYAVLLGEPSVSALMNSKNLHVYTAWFTPSFDGYVSIRMVLDTMHFQGWVVFSRGDNDWYSKLFKLRSHSIRFLTTDEVQQLIPYMATAFSDSQLENLDRIGLDGMGIRVTKIADRKTERFGIWSPDSKLNPAVIRLLNAMLNHSYSDALYLYDYLGLNRP